MGKVSSVKRNDSRGKLRKKNKVNVFNSKGFTLVELLATIAILSIVSVIVVFTAVSIIDNTKRNTYEVTINNVEKYASNFVLEEQSSIKWIDGNTNDYQYQCITVQNLIDTGYFKSDILDSYVNDDQTVNVNDYVYLERDSETKALTKNILLVNDRLSNYSGLCSDIEAGGSIVFDIEPDGWSLEKKITIKYDIYNNLDNVSNYEYSYVYNDDNKSNNFNKLNMQETIEVSSNGILTAMIIGKDNRTLISKTLVVDKIDNVDPNAKILSAIDIATSNIATSNTATVQKVILEFNDNASIAGYYFGKENPNSQTVSWTELEGNGVRRKTLTANVNSEGVWYLGVKDIVGNVTVVSKNFYKTILSVSNATVNPTYVITVENESFSVPWARAQAYHTFKGWYENSDYSGDRVNLYTAIKDSTLYGKVDENNLTGGAVKITGTNTYGETLRAEITSYSTPNADSYTYQWYTNSANNTTDGTPIDGATSNTLRLKGAYIGDYVYVVVTANKTNYRSETFSDKTDSTNNSTATVAKRDITVTADSNSKIYDGSSLIDDGCSITSGDLGFVSQTLSCTMTSGSTITNPGTINNVISSVTIKNTDNSNSANYYNITKVNGTLTVNKAEFDGGSVNITGTNTYGNTLTANVTNTNPAVNYTYQWYTNSANNTTGGTAISGETSSTLRLKGAYIGDYVYVVVTANKTNYQTKTFSDITDLSNGTAQVAKRDITVTADSNSKIYDGSSLIDDGCSITSGDLGFSGQTLSCTMTSGSTITNPGTKNNVISSVTIKNTDKSDATNYYNITKIPGELTINQLNKFGGSVKISGTNIYGNTLTASLTSRVNGATYTYQWYTNSANNTTGGTAISGATSSTLQLKQAQIGKYIYVKVTATKTTFETKVYSVVTTASENFSATVAKRPITITAASKSIKYNGSALRESGCTITSGSLAYEHRLFGCNMTSESTITSVGTQNNVINSVVIKNPSGDNVSDCYNITKVNGTLTVNKADLSGGSVNITGTNTYGDTLTANVTNTNPVVNYTYQWYMNSANSTTGGTAISGATSSTLRLQQAQIGKYIYVVVTTVNNNYQVKTFKDKTDSTNNSTAKVAKRPITITAASKSIKYNGSSLTERGCTITSGSLAYEHRLSGCNMTSESTITSVGSKNNVINSVVIKNPSDSNVSDCYNITKVNGTLTVNKADFSGGSVKITGTNTYGNTLTANVTAPNPAAQKYVYQWYTNNSNSTTGGTLVAKHESSSLTDNIQLTATHFEKYIYVVVTAVKDNYTSKSFSDKTDSTNNSTAKVAKRPITVTADSNEKIYNGSSLTDSGCTITSGSLAYEHGQLSCTMTSGSYRANVGSTSNVINTVVIKNPSGYNVAGYYNITKVNGTLTVNKASTAVVGSCKSGLVYNGSGQTLASGGSFVSYSNNTKTNAGDYNVTVTADSNHKFDDGTTSKQLNCSIAKKTPTITLSATSGTVESSKTLTFTEKANTAGKFNNTSNDTDVATVSPASYNDVAKNTAKTVTITGVKSGKSTITVRFTPTDTTNWNEVSKTYTVTTTPTYKLVSTSGTWYIWSKTRYMWYGSNPDGTIEGLRIWDANGQKTTITSKSSWVPYAKKYAMGQWNRGSKIYICEDGGVICSDDEDVIYDTIDANGKRQILAFVRFWIKLDDIYTKAVLNECASYYRTEKDTYGGPCEGLQKKTFDGVEYMSAWVSKYAEKDGGYSIAEYFG